MMNKRVNAGRGINNQRGIATILVVVLVGVVITAVAFGTMHTMRSTQEKQLATHAATHAQNSLWSGVEAFRLYLEGLDAAGVDGMDGLSEADIDFGAFYGDISAENITVETVGGSKRVRANIVNKLDAAKASAGLAVVFELQQGSTSGPSSALPASLNFYDDLTINGAIDFTGPSGSKLDINVDGVVDLNTTNLSAIGTLSSTQSVNISYGVIDVDLVHSNGDVVIEHLTTTIGEVQSRANVYIRQGPVVTTVKANGNIESNTMGYSASLNALGDIQVELGTHGTATAGGTIDWTSDGDFTALNAVGDISIDSGGSGGDVVSESNVDCSRTDWAYTSVSANGTTSNCTSGTPTENAANNVALMPPVTEVSLDPYTVDVYKLQGHANWVFTYDSTHSRMLVRVQNVNGIADGTYMVGSKTVYSPAYSSNVSHLCEVPASGNTCTTLVTPQTPICIHSAANSECFFYESGTWRLDGASAAPGIMWFEGDVNMNNGTNITTILATGNIDTGGNFKGYAVNYAGFEHVCQAKAPTNYPSYFDESVKTRYTEAFTDVYPTNLCDMTENKLKDVKAGNIALAAGGYQPPSTVYTGGNIELAASNEVYGTVLAGNAFTTAHGDTNVYGHIVAANASDSDSTKNKLNGSTNVDLSSLPDTYNPTDIPNMGDSSTGGGGSTGGGVEAVKLLWSKYL